MELNNAMFCGQYSAADAPEVLFGCIRNCAKIAIMSNNPYTNCQLINNVVRLLLTAGLYQRAFKEWDHLTHAQQMWIALRTLIQEAFQRCLNATTPTADHHGYAPTQPFQYNAFGVLAEDDDNNEASISATVATQVAALTYHSQLTQSTATSTSQRQDQQIAQIAAVQGATHETLHHIIEGLNTLAFNVSNAGRGCYIGCGYGGQGCGCGRMQGCGCGLPAYIDGFPQGRGKVVPPILTNGGGPPGGFYGGPAGVPPPYRAPSAMNREYYPTIGYGVPPGPSRVPPAQMSGNRTPT
jgi:hypothetical protein